MLQALRRKVAPKLPRCCGDKPKRWILSGQHRLICARCGFWVESTAYDDAVVAWQVAKLGTHDLRERFGFSISERDRVWWVDGSDGGPLVRASSELDARRFLLPLVTGETTEREVIG